MTFDIYSPEHGTTCPALINEDYEYKFSDDCRKFCTCAITGSQCIGTVVADSEEASTNMFSRAKCHMSTKKLNQCPMYGLPKDLYIQAVKHRAELKLQDTLNQMGN